MPWPDLGIWSNKTAAELRPVIVALCNAVGDRYECIGRERPYWTVNLDQSEDTLDIGSKNAPLVEEDLYRLDLFRYAWWGGIANGISYLVNRGSATFPVSSETQCGGWSKTGTGTGHGTDLWTLEELEDDVGLGTLSQSVIGGPMHLFDEIAPQRFRQMLDRLIYPVIFPANRRDYPTLEAEGFTTAGDLDDEEKAAAFLGPAGFPTDPQDGDDVWPMTTFNDPDLGAAYRGWLFGRVSIDIINSDLDSQKKAVANCVLDFEACENETGLLGEILAQYLVVQKPTINNLVGVDLEVLGTSLTLSGSNEDLYQEIADSDFLSAITGKLVVPMDFTNFANDPDSPFDGSRPPYSAFGAIFASLKFGADTEGNHSTRPQCTRFVLDITAHCSDQ